MHAGRKRASKMYFSKNNATVSANQDYKISCTDTSCRDNQYHHSLCVQNNNNTTKVHVFDVTTKHIIQTTQSGNWQNEKVVLKLRHWLPPGNSLSFESHPIHASYPVSLVLLSTGTP